MTSARTRNGFEKHIEALVSAGSYYAIYELTGRVDLNRLSRHLYMVVSRGYQQADLHLLWFRTGETVSLCFSGNMIASLAIEDLLSRMTTTGATGGVSCLMSGKNQTQFMDSLLGRLSQFTQHKLKRSYGGSRLAKG